MDTVAKWGTGGMATKIVAAKTASCAGIQCVLVNGKEPERILDFMSRYAAEDGTNTPVNVRTPTNENTSIVAAENRLAGAAEAFVAEGRSGDDESTLIGTYFRAVPSVSTMKHQRRWILALPAKGRIVVNAGAAEALFKKKSLLAAGVVRIEGSFVQNDCVQILVCAGDHAGVHADSKRSPSREKAYGEKRSSVVGSAGKLSKVRCNSGNSIATEEGEDEEELIQIDNGLRILDFRRVNSGNSRHGSKTSYFYGDYLLPLKQNYML